MLTPDLTEEAAGFLDSLSGKEQEQIWKKIAMLCEKPSAGDVKQLVGYPYMRCRARHFRIIYEVQNGDTLAVLLMGHRRDDEIYKELHRLYG